MKCLSKKILCYIFIGFLTFSVTSTVYYKSVHAMEWVGGALAFEEALKWLLASIGITATAGMTDAYWQEYGDEFTDYAIENGATQTEVAEWQLKACQGIIDKGSVVWQKFKAWASDLVNGSSSGVEVPLIGANSDVVLNYINSVLGSSIPSTGLSVVPVYAFQVNFNSASFSNFWYARLYTDQGTYYIGTNKYMYVNIPNTYIHYQSKYKYEDWKSDYGARGISTTPDYQYCYYSSNIINNYANSVSGTIPFGENANTPDENFEATDTNVNNMDVISSDGVNEDESEVTTTMPGVSDSDNEASKDAYQDIIDAINDGTITQEQGIEKIQEILKVITYDTVTDEVVPPQKNDDGTDKTKDDALKENKENMGFTLGGLESVFPFCIPFDIYAFMTLLVAEPECPEFDFPIKSVNGQVEEIHVDLAPFEPVAVVVRYCFDFLFIIGLAMLTRSLIGGGSSD